LVSVEKKKRIMSRVARWYIFKRKIKICVNFVGSCHGRYILSRYHCGLFYGHLVYFVAMWNMFGHLVYFHVLVCCTEINLATLAMSVTWIAISSTEKSWQAVISAAYQILIPVGKRWQFDETLPIGNDREGN
jgi:hypothetical protein